MLLDLLSTFINNGKAQCQLVIARFIYIEFHTNCHVVVEMLQINLEGEKEFRHFAGFFCQ